jgi:DNA-binding XRE family transcriptional regulator
MARKPRLTAATFKAWRERLGMTATDAARAIGCSRTSIGAWESGRNKIPRYIALACQAIANGLPPMG